MRHIIGIIRGNAHRRNRVALNRRKQNAAQGVSNCRSKSGFKRISRKFAVTRMDIEIIELNRFRLFESFKQIFSCHQNSLF